MNTAACTFTDFERWAIAQRIPAAGLDALENATFEELRDLALFIWYTEDLWGREVALAQLLDKLGVNDSYFGGLK